mmetsp:Transcript_12350/g.28997  ORF Transcript_12350/g.28997 Transcript_12350/m.28997 type:complete len:227 (-) Transcript_12350:3106-3786(-)
MRPPRHSRRRCARPGRSVGLCGIAGSPTCSGEASGRVMIAGSGQEQAPAAACSASPPTAPPPASPSELESSRSAWGLPLAAQSIGREILNDERPLDNRSPPSSFSSSSTSSPAASDLSNHAPSRFAAFSIARPTERCFLAAEALCISGATTMNDEPDLRSSGRRRGPLSLAAPATAARSHGFVHSPSAGFAAALPFEPAPSPTPNLAASSEGGAMAPALLSPGCVG